jgi:acetyl esterase
MESKILSFDEKLKLAQRMRNSNRFKPIENKEFEKFEVKEEKISVLTDVGNVNVYKISSLNLDKVSPAIINLHGGGFINKRLDRDKLFCFELASKLNCVVFDIDYKLSPEYVYPVALNESQEVLQWIFRNSERLKISKDRICIVGHSAGGNLAIGSIVHVLEKNLDIVNKAVIEYAALDLYTDPGEKPNYERDLPSERARIYNSFYCKPSERKNSSVSPAYLTINEVKRFPKSLIITAGEDKLNVEGKQFFNKLKKAGVNAEYKMFNKSVHGFTINRMDEYKESIDAIIRFLEY